MSEQQQQQSNTTKKDKSGGGSMEIEKERVRNRFINHEFNKLDRTLSRINAPLKSNSNSDTESESDSEYFLKKTTTNHHHHQSKASNSPQHPSSKPTSSLNPPQPSSTTTTTTTTNGKKNTPPHATTVSPDTTLSTSELNLYSPRPSLLSSESTGVGYKGLLNLVVILLILTSFRLVILNHLTYGIRIDLNLLAVSEWQRWPGVIIALSINLYILAAYAIEKAASLDLLPTKLLYALRVINSAAMVVIPSASVLAFKPNPASGVIVMIIVCTYSMKIISYSYENSKQRKLHTKKQQKDVVIDPTIYPNNLSLKSTYWFMLVPTLVYQLSYPRSPRIRKAFLLRRIVEALFLSALIFWMVEQYMVPLVENSVIPMEQYDTVRIIERVMKLSIPNITVWLLGFYVFFHLYLNICAEITRFGDREFYRDWWNSTGLDYFWRTWNVPVHQWMVVIIYTPMRRRGWSKNMGYFMCFFVSAIFHELVISIPFQTLKLWGFLGIMCQMVLIALTKGKLNGSNSGNVVFWMSLVIGQPYIVLQYYKAFIQEHPHLYPKSIMMINDYNS